MKVKNNKEKEKKINFLEVLKKILLDQDNSINEIPGLDVLEDQATTNEEKALIKELKSSQAGIDKNVFKSSLKVKEAKLKEEKEDAKVEEKEKSHRSKKIRDNEINAPGLHTNENEISE